MGLCVLRPRFVPALASVRIRLRVIVNRRITRRWTKLLTDFLMSTLCMGTAMKSRVCKPRVPVPTQPLGRHPAVLLLDSVIIYLFLDVHLIYRH